MLLQADKQAFKDHPTNLGQMGPSEINYIPSSVTFTSTHSPTKGGREGGGEGKENCATYSYAHGFVRAINVALLSIRRVSHGKFTI